VPRVGLLRDPNPEVVTVKALSQLWTAFGTICVALTLLLSVPGAVRVRAADDAPAALSSQDPALEQLVEAPAAPIALGSAPAPACGNAAERAAAPSPQEQLAAHLARVRAAAGEQAEGAEEVVVLNGRGYNYTYGDESPSAAMQDVQLRRELSQQPR